jgi:hypothetical protein
MAADTFDSILGLIQQGTGNNNNSWGTTFNNSFAALAARAIGGVATRSNTGGSLDLSTVVPPAGPRVDIDAIQLFNGALVSDLTVTVPVNSKMTLFQNSTSGAFNLFVKTPGGTAPPNLIQIPQGLGVWVMSDGAGNLIRHDDSDIGSFRISGKTAAGPGELACDGSSKLRASFPNLFAKIGTTWGSADGTHFTLPLLTDTGRFLRSSASGLSVGTYQSNQNLSHTHTLSGVPAVGSLTTDSQGSHTHTINISDPTHTHTNNAAGNFANHGIGEGGSFTGNSAGAATINAASTGVSATAVTAGAHTHTVTGTLTLGTIALGSSGGTEARPESAVVLICIRY